MSARIDAHQHIWRVERGDYGWLKPELEVLYRDFAIHDLAPHLDAAAIDGTVLVQAAPTVAETEFLLETAEQEERVLGVVGWIAFESASGADDLARLAAHPRLCGVRPMIQDLPHDGWMLRKALAPSFEAVLACDLVFDALVLPRHLPNLRALCARYPELRVVIDHGAKPDIARWGADPAARETWRAGLASLAHETPAMCKLSGLVTEASEGWSVDDLAPFVETLFELFGPERLVWGSDWPVVNLAGGFDTWWQAVSRLTAQLSPAEHTAVFGGNASQLYRLEVHS